jgi:hypothetical protein
VWRYSNSHRSTARSGSGVSNFERTRSYSRYGWPNVRRSSCTS